ncbi:MAG: hypothetical protein MJK04_36800, partial [Psychrosphaera sp.]|nr:hypothetical protein [Psychrosphaera sp.]
GALLLSESAPVASHAIKWIVEGNGTVTPANDSNTSGIFEAQLTLPTIVGEVVKVTGSFDAAAGGISTPEFVIEPGIPASIDITKLGKTVIGGLGGVELTITVKDQYGNNVTDGTPVDIAAPFLDVEGSLHTLGGVVSAKILGVGKAGVLPIIVGSGEIVKAENIQVHDVTMAFNMPEKITAGQSLPVSITVSSAYGDLSGLKLDLAIHRGMLSQRFATVSGGGVTVEYAAGDYRGAGRIFGRIKDRLTYHDFEVIDPVGEPYILDPVILSDVSGPGSFTLGDKVFEYSNETHIMIPGVEDEVVSTSLINNMVPTLVPLAELPMTAPLPDDGIIIDKRRGHLATATNVSYEKTGLSSPANAYVFANDGSIVIDDPDGLQMQGDVGFTLKFSPKTFGSTLEDGTREISTLVDYLAAGMKLTFVATGELLLEVTTDVKQYSLQSEAPLAAEQWYDVAAHIRGDQLILEIDGKIVATTIAGTVITGHLPDPDADPDAEPEPEPADYAIKLGEKFDGLMAGLSLYDWSEASTVAFRVTTAAIAQNVLQTTAVVQDDGFARVAIRADNAPVLAALHERFVRLNKHRRNGYFLPMAYAADPDECVPFVENEDAGIFSSASAYILFLASSDVQQNINEARIEVQTAQGKTDRVLAIMKLATKQRIYSQLIVAGKVIGFVPGCVDGAVTGDSSSGAAITCDLVTSVFLIGDIRDFLIHSYYLWDDDKECQGKECRFNLPVYVFSIAGIGMSIAGVFTGGALLIPDAVIAGLKVLAKLYPGDTALTLISKYLDEVVIPAPISEWATKMEVILPAAQLIAVVYWYGGDIKDFVSRAIQSKPDFDAWVDYIQRAFGAADAKTAAAKSTGVGQKFELQFEQQLKGIFQIAYAAATDEIFTKLLSKNVVEFRKLLISVNGVTVAGKGPKSDIAKSFTQAIKMLSNITEKTPQSEIAKIMEKHPTVQALSFIHFVGDKDALAAMRRFPCTPSTCGIGKSMETFMESIANLDKLHLDGKITPEAIRKLGKVFSDLGHYSQTSKKVVFNMAAGAAGVIKVVNQLAKTRKIVDFEIELNKRKEWNHRFMDILTDDGILHEVKGWRIGLEAALVRLGGGFDKTFGKEVNFSNQMFKDLVSTATGDGAKKLWTFSDDALEASKPEMLVGLVKAIKSNDEYREILGKMLDLDEDALNLFLRNDLKSHLAALLGIE